MGGNKKGGISLTLETVIELILIMVVIVGLLVYVNSQANDTFFEKSFMVRDLSILSNSIQSVPGNVYYKYVLPLSPTIASKKYEFSFNNNLITITEEDYSKIFYPFFYNDYHLKNFHLITGAKEFYLSDYNNHLIISNRALVGMKAKQLLKEYKITDKIAEESEKKLQDKLQETEQLLLECESIASTIEIKSIVLDAAAGDKENSEGKVNVEATQIENEITFNTVDGLSNLLSNYDLIKTRLNSKVENDFTFEDRINKIPTDASLLISLHAGENKDETLNGIRIFIRANDEQSNKLACLLLSKLYKTFPQLEKPGEIIIAAEQDEKMLYLNKQGINKYSLSIKLELGNINYANNPLYIQTAKVTDAIKDAIDQYIKGVTNNMEITNDKDVTNDKGVANE